MMGVGCGCGMVLAFARTICKGVLVGLWTMCTQVCNIFGRVQQIAFVVLDFFKVLVGILNLLLIYSVSSF